MVQKSKKKLFVYIHCLAAGGLALGSIGLLLCWEPLYYFSSSIARNQDVSVFETHVVQNASQRMTKLTLPSNNIQEEDIPSSSQTRRYTVPLSEFEPPRPAPFLMNKNHDRGGNTFLRPLPRPLQIMDQYIQWHSKEAIQSNPVGRKYLVAFYKCPLSAGNRIHTFTSAYLLAILSNRTLLWKYMDDAFCMQVRRNFKLRFNQAECQTCQSLSSSSDCVRECDAILTRQSWMASFDEWKERLHLQDPECIKAMPTMARSSVSSLMNRTIIRSDLENAQVQLHHPWRKRMDDLILKHNVRSRIRNEYANQTLQDLTLFGLPFLFGALIKTAFDFTPAINSRLGGDPAVGAVDESAFTVALHSRHEYPASNGCDISQEQECFNHVLDTANRTGSDSCRVVILSDRICTVDNLTRWLAERHGCVGINAEKQMETATIAEHGPFSGAGFFQDIALAGKLVNDAVIGTYQPGQPRWRTSSELVEELVAYTRVMRAWKAGRDPSSLPDLVTCTLDVRNGQGENNIIRKLIAMVEGLGMHRSNGAE